MHDSHVSFTYATTRTAPGYAAALLDTTDPELELRPALLVLAGREEDGTPRLVLHGAADTPETLLDLARFTEGVALCLRRATETAAAPEATDEDEGGRA